MERFDIKHHTLSQFSSEGPGLDVPTNQQQRTQKMVSHPVKEMQDKMAVSEEQLELKKISQLYGSHMAMRIARERAIFGMETRLMGGSSYHGLRTQTDDYEKFDFGDWLGVPAWTPSMHVADRRKAVEQRFGVM